MRVFPAIKRWSRFLDGLSSVSAAVALASFRAISPVACPRLRVPLRIEGVEDPVYCRPGTSDFHTLLQLWDQDEYRLASEFVESPVEHVVDLGSNIGLSVRFFAALWPEARILAVEPDSENFALARRNVASLVAEGRVELRHCFVGGEAGFAVPMREPGSGRNEIRMGERHGEEVEGGVPVRTMWELLQTFPGNEIDFLKCDIEGAERMLLEGGPDWLRRVRSFVVELHEIDPDWLWHCVGEAGMSIEKRRILPVSGYDYHVVWARLGRS